MLYITGNMHGEMARFEDSRRIRKLKKGDTLIVCGDFGFLWDGGAKEEKNLKKLGSKKYQILFVDGTHENFDLLEKYPITDWNGGKVQQIGGNVYHLMRGQVYELEGKKIFTFGGGESTEKQMYIEAGKWWEQEMPGLEEMRTAVDNLRANQFQVDYILTHEPAPRDAGAQGQPKGHYQPAGRLLRRAGQACPVRQVVLRFAPYRPQDYGENVCGVQRGCTIMRILHTSDWHLGKMLFGRSLLEDQTYFVDRVFLPLVEREHPDLILNLAGDVFDRPIAPVEAIQLFDHFIEETHRLGVPLAVISGNHDGAGRMALGAPLLRENGVAIATKLEDAFQPVLLSERVHCYLLPYFEPAQVRQVLGVEVRGFQEAYRAVLDRVREHFVPGACNVLAAHCFVMGGGTFCLGKPYFCQGEAPRSARRMFRGLFLCGPGPSSPGAEGGAKWPLCRFPAQVLF